jgi:poly-gamma-glutamate synthesis protein (capsule biosynthesis protein)
MSRAVGHASRKLIALAAVLLGPAGAACTSGQPPQIAVTGDILLAGGAERQAKEDGAASLFVGVREVLIAADVAIGNLECALAASGSPADKSWTFRAHPDAAAALLDAGYDLVTLANNHSMDYGPEALIETMCALESRDIGYVGAGKNAARARQHVILESGAPPIRIAVLAFSNMLPTSFYATDDRPGTNPARLETIEGDVAAARGAADVVIVLFHWGDELSSTPSDRQRRLAHAAADAGADLVVGHHPHVLQGLELRGRSLIAYSLGNFLFPSRGETRHTMILRYTPHAEGRAVVEIIPCMIDGFRPRMASSEERAANVRHLRALSEELGAAVPDDAGIIRIQPRADSG